MESWGAKKMRTKRTSAKLRYNRLPRELQIDIFRRLPAKDLSRSMCVSKPWRDLILHTCSPISSLTLRFLGLVLRLESHTKSETPPGWISVFVENLAQHPVVGLDELIEWCSRMMHCKVTARKLIDSCNGLLLFCHRDGKAENFTHKVYYYYVINPITKQCLAVLKPGPRTAQFMYAALAYDPAESWFFKIVRFQGCRHVNVFSSETGCWTSLRLDLPQEVAKAKWVRKSVYSKGAIYRLSSSEHLIKFLVDPQENAANQAVAIKLPCPCFFYRCHRGIGVRNKKIIFVFSAGTSMIIWELNEHCDGSAYTFNWCQTQKVDDWLLWELNSYGQLLAIHPYYGIAFFKQGNYICYYFYCQHTMGSRAIENEGVMYRYITTSGLSLLECSIPFACCLEKKVTISQP